MLRAAGNFRVIRQLNCPFCSARGGLNCCYNVSQSTNAAQLKRQNDLLPGWADKGALTGFPPPVGQLVRPKTRSLRNGTNGTAFTRNVTETLRHMCGNLQHECESSIAATLPFSTLYLVKSYLCKLDWLAIQMTAKQRFFSGQSCQRCHTRPVPH